MHAFAQPLNMRMRRFISLGPPERFCIKTVVQLALEQSGISDDILFRSVPPSLTVHRLGRNPVTRQQIEANEEGAAL